MEREDTRRVNITQQDEPPLLGDDSDNNGAHNSHNRLPSRPISLTKLYASLVATALLTGFAVAWGYRIEASASELPGHGGGQKSERTATQGEPRTLTFSPSVGVGARGAFISWLSNLDRCVGVLGGLKAARKATHLKLVRCSDDALVFSVPTPDDPHLRLVDMPELCVDNPGQTELQLWDCNDSSAHDNLGFFIRSSAEYSSSGTIRTIKNESRCMNVSWDEIGSPVQMWDCSGKDHELFAFRVDDSGAAADSNSTNDSSHHDSLAAAKTVNEDEDERELAPAATNLASSATPRAQGALIVLSWTSNLDLCAGVAGGLKAAKKSVHLKLANCTDEDALVFSVPTPDAPYLRVMAMPQLCVDNPGETELQLWDCNDSSAHDNLRFVLRPSHEDPSVGTIRTFKNESRCMNCPRDEIGSPVQMWACFPDFKHELFMLRVDHSGAAAASKSMELHHGGRHEKSNTLSHRGAPAESRSLRARDDLRGRATVPASSTARGAFIATSRESTANLCVGVQGGLKAAKNLAPLELVSCSDDALAFSVPTPDGIQLRLMAKPELCVQSSDLIQLQLGNCNDSSVQQSFKFFPTGNGNDSNVGMIRMTKNESMCMDYQWDRAGTPVKLNDCLAELKQEFILMSVEESSAEPVST